MSPTKTAMNNLTKRLLSGIAYVVVFIGCIVYGQESFCILFAVTTALALNEYNDLIITHKLGIVNNTVSIISGVYLFLATYCIAAGVTSPVIFLPYLLSLLFMLTSELYMKRPDPIANWAYSFSGQIYIALPFSLLNLLAFYGNNGIYTYTVPLAVFIFIWVNDTGAYCFGSMLHKKIPYKLFERISPNKSWIGFFGGVAMVLAAACIHCLVYSSINSDIRHPLLHWMGFGLVVAVFGTWGDLVESLLKRKLGIKDSGRFLPGHGGVLDRFDSALLAIPASVIYLYAFHFI